MKLFASIAGLLASGVFLSGCADNSLTSLLDDRGSQPQAQTQTNQDLSMPPDLQLRPPGTGAAPQTTATAQPLPTTQTAALSQPAAPVAAEPQGDIYERNGISKVKPDGTPKTTAELQAELKQIYLAKKQQENPNYGTIFNIGNIFDDG